MVISTFVHEYFLDKEMQWCTLCQPNPCMSSTYIQYDDAPEQNGVRGGSRSAPRETFRVPFERMCVDAGAVCGGKWCERRRKCVALLASVVDKSHEKKMHIGDEGRLFGIRLDILERHLVVAQKGAHMEEEIAREMF